MIPVFDRDGICLYNGEAFQLLRELETASFDAVITDPPYSSGGFTRGDRMQTPSAKYVIQGTEIERPEFFGDNRDQRSFLTWATLWISECRRVVKPGGYCMLFTDWRQLPLMTDALQAGGFVWRGIAPWDKTEAAKPQRGWFRHQCEYVVLGCNGSIGKEQDRVVPVCAPGLVRKAVNSREKFHMTGKPVEVMRFLMQVLPKGARVLDPFAGSGTTLVAAAELELQATGFELSEELCKVSVLRLDGSTKMLC